MLGDKIKNLRKEKGVTQQELANAVEVVQSTIGMIESGKKTGSPKTLKKIADFFDVTVDYLLANNEIKENVELSKKAERDIAKDLERTLNELENSQDALMFSGEPLDDETRELLRISLENSMRLAKQIAKKKYTPKKYR
jgi:transcriptional regulator with XRE-family HTH domain